MEALKLSRGNSIGGREVFPRPDYVRDRSFLLDGRWHIIPDPKKRGEGNQWYRRENAALKIDDGTALEVTVPFSLEADINQASLAPRGYDPKKISRTKRFWYVRTFSLPDDVRSGIIHFGAADYRATVWLNGRKIAAHRGGYTPFQAAVDGFEKVNFLAVAVEDSFAAGQARGKQTFLKDPFMVWYTGCTGLWQSVWIEPAERIYVENIVLRRQGGGKLVLTVKPLGASSRTRASLDVVLYKAQIFGRESASRVAWKTSIAAETGDVTLSLPEGVLEHWSAERPALHAAEATLRQGTRVLDRVRFIIGRRDVETKGPGISMNGKDLYQKLLLHQGYYPQGLYTPADPATYRKDIELMKKSGFNGCRLHQKIESPRFHYWADLLGFLVWQEMPSYYLPGKRRERLLETQLDEAMRRDSMHPSIISIVIYNESWGKYNMFLFPGARRRLRDQYRRVKEAWPGYLVIDNSGFHHVESDITDIHHYIFTFERTGQFYDDLCGGLLHLPFWKHFIPLIAGKEWIQTPYLKGYGEPGKPLLVSEFGGYGFGMYKHEDMTLPEFLERHLRLIHERAGIRGYCYTQFTDTFDEANGLFTIEREPKVKGLAEILKKAERESKRKK